MERVALNFLHGEKIALHGDQLRFSRKGERQAIIPLEFIESVGSYFTQAGTLCGLALGLAVVGALLGAIAHGWWSIFWIFLTVMGLLVFLAMLFIGGGRNAMIVGITYEWKVREDTDLPGIFTIKGHNSEDYEDLEEFVRRVNFFCRSFKQEMADAQGK